MSEMVEHVAWEAGISMRQARAAIEAIREPTERVKSAGIDALTAHINDHDDGHLVAQIYRAMIDAALRDA